MTNRGELKLWHLENRMSSYMQRGNKLIAEGKTPEAMKLVERGLQYYSGKIIKSINPYAKADAGLLVFVLRYLADEIEKGNPGAKEVAEGMKECIIAPYFEEVEKVRKANQY